MSAIDVVESVEVLTARQRSNANLVKFKPGQSGNPNGQAGGAASNAMYYVRLFPADITSKELRKVVKDAKLPDSKRTAAHIILLQRHKDPAVALRTFAEVTDRLEGRAVQKIITADVGAGVLSGGEVLARLRAMTGATGDAHEPATCDHEACTSAYCPCCGEAMVKA